MRVGFLLLLGLAWTWALTAQTLGTHWHPENGNAYLSESLPEVHITCAEMGWIMQQENWYSNVEHPATFVFSSETYTDTVENVGFRLRGNTSRGAPKKSFKVSFNTFDDTQAWQGLKKMNLNGEHNDPSAMRARLSWECLRDAGVPVSRSTHVKLFINGNYYGLYSNTEHIDGEWLEKRFDHAHGNLWKCTYPANLAFVSSNPDAYKFTPSWSEQRVYELKTNNLLDDYSSLAEFIDILNNTSIESLPCALEAVFDVDAYLKVAAGEILLGHWDNYIGNKNNFYLYERTTDGRLTYIPYDMDNTMGIQWFGEWTDQDIYNWTSENDRALYTRLLEVPAYRDRFTWYIQWWMDNYYSNDWLEARGAWLIDLLADAVAEDSYYPLSYGFDLEDFENSIQTAWGSHVAHSPSDYTSSRLFWASIQLEDLNPETPPVVQCWAENPVLTDTLSVKCWAPELANNAGWSFDVTVEIDGTTAVHPMAYAGANGHGHEWEAQIELNSGTDVFWKATSTDPNGGLQDSPCSMTRVWNTPSAFPLRINEVMPINQTFNTDENGNDGDWIELINNGINPVNCSGIYLSNRRLEPWRWPLPSVTLEPGQHLLIWCDDQTDAGPLHANFTLSGTADEAYLFRKEEDTWRVVDAIEWSNALPDFSYGRVFDGAPEWVWFNPNSSNPPTPNAANGTSIGIDFEQALKNPPLPTLCEQPCRIQLDESARYTVFNAMGQLTTEGFGPIVHIDHQPHGMYVLHIENFGSQTSQKIILQ